MVASRTAVVHGQAAIVKWYDRRRRYRLHPDLLAAGNHGPFSEKKEKFIADRAP